MNILIVAATRQEIEPLLSKMDFCEQKFSHFFECRHNNNEITIHLTGVGMVITAIKTLYALSNHDYDLVFNAGICGSFNRNLEIGTVVNVVDDCFSELGAEDGEEFLSLSELGLDDGTAIYFDSSREGIDNYILNLLPKVNGITVNTVHGNEKSIDKVVSRFHPMVETMEGAAFMLACSTHFMPYAQIRSVSNYVERRNKDNWNIPLAIENLNKKVMEILNAF